MYKGIRKIINEELNKIFNESKMSELNMDNYYSQHKDNKRWLEVLSHFPEKLQREIVIERPDGTKEDINELKGWVLTKIVPIKINTEKILQNNLNLDTISRTPKEVVDYINDKHGLNVKYGKVYDKNPNRYFEYSKLSSDTAEPSVMVNGEIIWGVGRYIASLIRGDKTLTVWNIIDN